MVCVHIENINTQGFFFLCPGFIVVGRLPSQKWISFPNLRPVDKFVFGFDLIMFCFGSTSPVLRIVSKTFHHLTDIFKIIFITATNPINVIQMTQGQTFFETHTMKIISQENCVLLSLINNVAT